MATNIHFCESCDNMGNFENLRANPQLVQDGDQSKSKLLHTWETAFEVFGTNFLRIVILMSLLIISILYSKSGVY